MFLISLVYAGFVKAEEENRSTKFEEVYQLYDAEKSGIRSFNKQNYESAFEKLSYAGQNGLKNAQHYLGMMYLKGLHVPQSVSEGMAWIAVANEVNIEEWTEIYTNLYELLPNEQKLRVTKMVEEYIEEYGMEAQGIKCAELDTIRSRRKVLQCKKKSEAALWILR